MTETPLDDGDIQGIVRSGYGKLLASRFLAVRLRKGRRPEASRWLRDRVGSVTAAADAEDASALDRAFNIAFTHPGLEVLGLDDEVLDGFPAEFRQGQYPEHRTRALGDTASTEGIPPSDPARREESRSAPRHWEWGGSSETVPHALLLLYAPTLGSSWSVPEPPTELFELVGKIESEALVRRGPDGAMRFREHFGFVDGIGQPRIRGWYEGEGTVSPELFLLGSGKGEAADASEALGGFGRNGSFLVFRMLEQDVGGFWTEMVDQTARDLEGRRERSAAHAQKAVTLACKMLGRWPNGMPLTLFPTWQQAESAGMAGGRPGPSLAPKELDDFLYRRLDAKGLRCPVASHVRRCNPRDALSDLSAEESLDASDRRRILRRGRTYGEALEIVELLEGVLSGDEADAGAFFDAVDAASSSGGKRGVSFIALNSSIKSQFEFVLQSWLMDPHFENAGGSDPLLGPRERRFSVPAEPVRWRSRPLPQFVHTRAGAYFFLPGREALRRMLDC